jgi:hypothetical protein
MRWEALFTDLEAELCAVEAADLELEIRDRVRREIAALRLTERVRPAVGHDVTVYADGAPPLPGRLTACGPDWLLLAEGHGQELLVPFGALMGITGLGRGSAAAGSEGAVGAKLDLRHALRGLARGRLPLAAVLRDSSTLHGTLDRVGADFVEISLHAPGEARRQPAVTGVRTVPLTALSAVRSG